MAYALVSRLAQLAEDQWGLVTSRQARAAGVSAAGLGRLMTGAVIERVAHGVYRLVGAPAPDHLDLRAAWLQLAPEVAAWDRTPQQGVVSHRSAAALYGLGHLPADRHEFTLPHRRQRGRPDIRFHNRKLATEDIAPLRGLLVTRPSRIAADLLGDGEDVAAIGNVIADALRSAHDSPLRFAESLAPHAAHFGFRRSDGVALFRWLLDAVGDPATSAWIAGARAARPRYGGSDVEGRVDAVLSVGDHP